MTSALRPSLSQPGAAPRRIQRACACGAKAPQGGDCEACKRKPLQRHAAAGSSAPNAAVTAQASVDAALATPGVGLGGDTRSLMESRFGHDFSRVRVHADTTAAASARALGAHAYATGEHLVFGAGHYAPHTRGGLWLLAHELAHTVQQRTGGAAMQASAEVAPANDPSEAAADRAADAVLGTAPMPLLQPAGPGLHCYAITKVDPVNDDEKLVHLDTGLRYRVRRSGEIVVRESLHNWVQGQPGADKERVWLEMEWCAGKNQGSLRFSADVPAQVAKALAAAVTQGADPRSIVRDARITPRADLKMLQSGDFNLSVGGEVTLNMNGQPTQWAGTAKLSTGPYDFGVKAGPGTNANDKPQGGQVVFTVDVTPGRKDKKQDCRREKRSVVEINHFSCQTERDIPAQDIPIKVPVTDRESRYLYFDYAKDRLDRSRSAAELKLLKTQLAEGFRVTNIAGFTSPEGPVDAGPGFIGNKALAQDRAAAAAKEVQALCPQPAAADAASASATAAACFVAGAQAAGSADPELYTRVVVDENGQVSEVEGTPLAEAAVGDFLQAPAEERHRTPENQKALDKQSTAKGKAKVVYPLLRRAVVSLVRQREVPGVKHVDASVDVKDSNCPQDVVDAAFGKPKKPNGG